VTSVRWFLTILSFAATIGVSGYVVASSWPAGGAALGLPWWTHVVLLGVVGVDLGFRVSKMVLGARAIGIPTSPRAALRSLLAGDFAASITPSRSGAEPARFLTLRESGLSAAHIVLVLFIELSLEVVSLAVLAVLFGVVWGDQSGMVRGLLATVTFYSSGILVAMTAAYLLARHRAHGPAPVWISRMGISSGTWRRIQLGLRQLRAGVTSLHRARVGRMTVALGFSVLHVATRLAILPIIVAASGFNAPLSGLVLWSMALLYGAGLAPAPGGGGVVELAFHAALGTMLPPSLVATSLIWWRVYTFYLPLLLGALATGRTVMRALRRTRPVSPAQPSPAAEAA
jgi:uncharacterized protein (TIRG00374 family)